MLQLQNLRCQRLAQVQNGTTAELLEVYLLRNLLANFVVGLNLLGFAQRNLLVFVFYFAVSHHDAVAVNLEVALVGVHDDVEVLVRAKHLGDDITETLLQHTHQCGAVNVFCLFKFLKGLNHRWAFRAFCCHNYIFYF